ncbi:hypothetical protein GCM10009771_15760 [Nesterenkonia flava]
MEVLTKEGCHLCEEAMAVTAQACAEYGLTPQQIDITHDDARMAQHAEEIPVLLINGRVRDFWRFDPQRLRRLLAEAVQG